MNNYSITYLIIRRLFPRFDYFIGPAYAREPSRAWLRIERISTEVSLGLEVSLGNLQVTTEILH